MKTTAARLRRLALACVEVHDRWPPSARGIPGPRRAWADRRQRACSPKPAPEKRGVCDVAKFKHLATPQGGGCHRAGCRFSCDSSSHPLALAFAAATWARHDLSQGLTVRSSLSPVSEGIVEPGKCGPRWSAFVELPLHALKSMILGPLPLAECRVD